MVFNIYLFSIGLSLIAAIVYLAIRTKNKDKTQKVILAILGLVFVMELIGSYTRSININNSLLSNLGLVYVESVLILYYFFKIEKKSNFKQSIRKITYLILFWGLINTSFFQSIFNVFQFFSFFPLSIFILFLSIRFLVKLWNFEIFGNTSLICIPHFWIVVGILFFYTESTIFFGLFQFFPELIFDFIYFFSSLNRLMAGVMYLFFGLSYFTPFFISEKNQL